MPPLPNSSPSCADSLHLVLEPSRLLNHSLAALHALAALCAAANPLPWWARLPLLFAVALSFRQARRDWLIDPIFRAVTLDVGGQALVLRRSGAVKAMLEGGSVVTAFVVILHVRTGPGRVLAVPIFRDSVEAEAFRCLRVGLRCGRWAWERGEV